MALTDYRAEMERCSQCSYCEFIPFDQMKNWRFSKGCSSAAYKNFGTYSARGRYNVAWSLLDGRSKYTDELKDIVYQCVTCGSCDVSCKICRYNLQPLDMIREFRAKLVEDGQTLSPHTIIVNSLRKEHNTMGESKSERGKWAKGLSIKQIPKQKAEVLFHVGCRYSFDQELWKVARAAVTLFQNAGVDIGIMGADESCCGGRVYSMGYRQDFAASADYNLQIWAKAGVKTIVTSCSDCYHAFKRLYTPLGLKINVMHTVEFLDKLINEGKIKFTKSLPLTVTYHDPCHLGRQGEPYVPWDGKEKKIKNQIVVYEPRKPRYNGALGVYDAPRNVLKSIPDLKLVEMDRIREYAWCCGAGGGVREAYPEYSEWTAAERIEEAKSTGAEAIVSACPWCERNFMDVMKNTDDSMQIIDIAELVQQAI